MDTYRVIDADGHILEPPDLFERYIEAPFRSIAPRLVSDNHGYERLLVEGLLHPKPEGKAVGITQGFNYGGRERYTDQLPGGFEPHARIKDMDLEGIERAALFPTLGLAFGAVENIPLAAAICRAYNNWLADYCGPYPDRLIGIGAVPIQGVEEAIREMRRVVKELGFKGIFLRPNPHCGRNWENPLYDPFYAEAQALGVPLMFHEGTGNHMPTAGIERYDNFFFTHTISHPFEMMLASLSIICGGVLERFPKLTVVFLEAGCSWMPYWLWRMDEHYEKRPQEVPWLRMKPSEYFQRQCYISCDPDETTMPQGVEALGEDKVIFASDYPHWDAVFPGAVKEIRERAGLSESAKRKILGENAARLYGLPC